MGSAYSWRATRIAKGARARLNTTLIEWTTREGDAGHGLARDVEDCGFRALIIDSFVLQHNHGWLVSTIYSSLGILRLGSTVQVLLDAAGLDLDGSYVKVMLSGLLNESICLSLI